MAANPPLVLSEGIYYPAPFDGEIIALGREGVEIGIDNMLTKNGRWSCRGALYLTSLRLVFVASKVDPETGLAAFELPLQYIQNYKFNQPILGCNNLSGTCWPAVEGGGPGGRLPPHTYNLYFKEGGVGTFLPLYFQYQAMTRNPQSNTAQQAVAGRFQASVNTAFVDPNDPTQVYLAQPVGDSQRRPDTPRYAPEYGKDESYEDMGLRP